MQYTLENIRDVKSVVALAQEMIQDRHVFDDIVRAIDIGSQRQQYIGSWVISRAVEIQPGIMDDNTHQICLNGIARNKEGGFRRNICRIWQFALPDSEDLKMQVLETALNLLSDHKQDIAVRVFSITVLENLLKYYPEIKEEVGFILEREYDQATPSFIVRADRFAKAVKRLKA